MLFNFVLFGLYTRFSSIMLSVLLVLGYGFSYSFGKADHNILELIVPICMAPSNWGNAYSLDAKYRSHTLKPVQAWPVALLAWFLSFAFFTSGVPKLMGGWLDPATQAVRGHLMQNFLVIDRTEFLAPLFMGLENMFAWELFDWATVIFELGFFVGVFHKRLLNVFIFVAVFFHMMNLLILNIVFLDNFTTYICFIGWAPLIVLLRRRGWEEAINRILSPSLLGLGVVLTLIFLFSIISPFYALWSGLDGIPGMRWDCSYTRLLS